MRSSLCVAVGLAALAGTARADELPSLSIYGFLRVDGVVDSAAFDDARSPHAVLPQRPGPAVDAELDVHARLSRIGLQVDEWQVSSKTRGEGQVEIDFLAGDHGVRLRHAWAALHPDKVTELLIGQTWDLVSPLYPLASPSTLLWNAGNTGGFRPQLRLTVASERVRVAAALAGHSGPDGTGGPDADADGKLDGNEGGLPMAQFLIEFRGRVRRGGEPARVGAWGHVARLELDSGADDTSYSIGLHAYAPLGKRVAVLGELTHGRNLAAIGGGLGHGFDATRLRGVQGTGGWAELTFTPTRRVLIAEGVAVDTARRDDLAVGERTSNVMAYVALRARPRDTVEVGVEGSYWSTGYKPAQDADDVVTARAVRVGLHTAVLF